MAEEKTNDTKIVPGSLLLRDILEREGWMLVRRDGDEDSIKDLEARGPAGAVYEKGQRYSVFPVPKENQSLEEAFLETKRKKIMPAFGRDNEVFTFNEIIFGDEEAELINYGARCSIPYGKPIEGSLPCKYSILYENNLTQAFEQDFFTKSPGKTRNVPWLS